MSDDLRHPSRFLRKEAVEHTTDQALLARMALRDRALCVRIAAAERLSDQEHLARVVRDSYECDVVLAAMERLDDQDVLREIAVRPASLVVREAEACGALMRGRSWALTGRWSSYVRTTAVSRLGDQQVLADLAENDPEPTAGNGPSGG